MAMGEHKQPPNTIWCDALGWVPLQPAATTLASLALPPTRLSAACTEAANRADADARGADHACRNALETAAGDLRAAAVVLAAGDGGDGGWRNSSTMTFDAFSAMNRARCEAPTGFNHALHSWSLSDWFTATMGELGEAANIAKKLNRERDGIRGNTEAVSVLRERLGAEIADTFIYLDLLAQAAGLSLGQIVLATFNAKSVQIGYVAPPGTAHPPIQLPDGSVHATVEAAVVHIVKNVSGHEACMDADICHPDSPVGILARSVQAIDDAIAARTTSGATP